jgi:PKD repeat protein
MSDRSLRVFAATACVLIAWTAHAATYTFRVAIDADYLVTSEPTGCSLPLPGNTTFPGTDLVLTTNVDIDEGTGAGRVLDVVASRCIGSTFATIPIETTGWSAAGPSLVVETRITPAQLLQVVPPGFRLGVKARLAFYIAPVSGTGGNAIVSDGASPILFPPSDPNRRRSVGASRKITLDGRKDDWGAVTSYAAGPAASSGIVRLDSAAAVEIGNTMYFRFDASVAGITFRATPDATPREGPAPLAVTFVTRGEYSGGQIFRYRWDFEGDGIFDTSDPGARNYTRTFTSPGVRDAVLEITSDRSVVTTATLRITVTGAPPIATASVNPSNGPIPLTVGFFGFAAAGSAPIVRYEWDFEGDGTFDYSSVTSGNTTHRYETAGTYNAVFRVTDGTGLRVTARATATAIRAGPPGSPIARITSPSAGGSRATGSAVSFGGTGTTTSGTITNYEWDFEGDGRYDFASSTSATASFTFNSPGIYTTALRVTNSAGLRGIATVDITVTMTASITVSTDTLRPPGTVSVQTAIGGTSNVTLFMRNRTGQTVRTLVNNVSRTAGNYTDEWDGLGDGGTPLPDAVYYAVMRYTTNGAPVTVDYPLEPPNAFYNPAWQLSTTAATTSSCNTCPFAPYEDNFLQATFTLTRASEVSVSIRGYDTVYEVARLFDRRPFGRGRSYTVVWEGTNAVGQLVDPTLYDDQQFIFGMTAFLLPQNAIYVELAPELTEVAVTPNYYDPATSDFLNPQRPNATIAFKLSKAATVRLQVLRAGTNAVLRTMERTNVAAGASMVTWDGRDDRGIFADKGDYRIALRAIDAAGNQSLVRYALLKVFY